MTEKSDRLRKAILYIVTSALFFAFMNMFVRLSGDVPTVQKTFFRNFFALVVASGVMIKQRVSVIPKKEAVADLTLRSVCGYGGVLCNFYALGRLNIADASLLNKMSPFFAIIFSIFLLKEKANKTQWAIIAVAFVGAMFVIKPSFRNAELVGSLAGFLGGICAGAAYTFVRRATQKGVKGCYVVFYFSVFSTLVSLPFVILDYAPMTTFQLLMLVGAGLSAVGGQFCITAAYSHAPAKEVSIYDYTQIIFSAAIGFIVMGDLPDALSFVGYAVILGAAFVMYRYNNRKVV
ncbi:MAG: DMT family transporter [Ruminococcaceae bacterium]|nr:DMT family transporter [Oscillospiraceae bacterium]